MEGQLGELLSASPMVSYWAVCEPTTRGVIRQFALAAGIPDVETENTYPETTAFNLLTIHDQHGTYSFNGGHSPEHGLFTCKHVTFEVPSQILTSLHARSLIKHRALHDKAFDSFHGYRP